MVCLFHRATIKTHVEYGRVRRLISCNDKTHNNVKKRWSDILLPIPISTTVLLFYGHYTGQPVLRYQHPQLRNGGFCWCKCSLPACPC